MKHLTKKEADELYWMLQDASEQWRIDLQTFEQWRIDLQTFEQARETFESTLFKAVRILRGRVLPRRRKNRAPVT